MPAELLLQFKLVVFQIPLGVDPPAPASVPFKSQKVPAVPAVRVSVAMELVTEPLLLVIIQ